MINYLHVVRHGILQCQDGSISSSPPDGAATPRLGKLIVIPHQYLQLNMVTLPAELPYELRRDIRVKLKLVQTVDWSETVITIWSWVLSLAEIANQQSSVYSSSSGGRLSFGFIYFLAIFSCSCLPPTSWSPILLLFLHPLITLKSSIFGFLQKYWCPGFRVQFAVRAVRKMIYRTTNTLQ